MKAKTKVFFDCRHAALYCAIALFFSVTPAFGQSQPTPGSGQAIQDEVTTVLGKTQNLMNNMSVLCDTNCQATPAGTMFKNKVAEMKAAQQRAEGANNRATANDYDKMNRRRSKNKDQDGCDPNVQVCVTPSGSYSVSASNNGPEKDDQTGVDVVDNLNDVATNVDTLNNLLSTNVPPPTPITEVGLTDADYFFPTFMWPSPAVVFAAFNVNQAAEKVAELAKPACDETLVALGEGGNSSLACLATEGIYMVANYAYEAMEFIVRERANAEITGAYDRIKDVYDNLSSADDAISYIEQRVYVMQQMLIQVEANQQCIMQLLTTPQGRRPGFPVSTGTCGASGPTTNVNIPIPPKIH